MFNDLKKEVNSFKDLEKGEFLKRFFKTGKGQYGEGDIFYGLSVSQSRKIAAKYKDLPLPDIKKLLQSEVHEERLIALLILVLRFKKSDDATRRQIFDFYLGNTDRINNWDLVDLSADKIVGEYLKENDRSVLSSLAASKSLWERRIAMIATYAFIKNGEYNDAFKIADILFYDPHDLIQKAVGWMLREVGKRVSEEKLEEYLKPRYKTMPRTALRYAIERFSEEKRKRYLRGLV